MKELTLCNFDFLLAAVRTISVSYLRSILEHARFYLLDRDVELIYYTVRKASDALTRDTLQLGAQIICWLRPCSGKRKGRDDVAGHGRGSQPLNISPACVYSCTRIWNARVQIVHLRIS